MTPMPTTVTEKRMPLATPEPASAAPLNLPSIAMSTMDISWWPRCPRQSGKARATRARSSCRTLNSCSPRRSAGEPSEPSSWATNTTRLCHWWKEPRCYAPGDVEGGAGGADGGAPGSLLDPDRGRQDPLPAVPARVQAERRAARVLLRAHEPGRPDGADHLRPLVRLLHRSDREEAAQPLLSRHVGAVVRHRRLQPRLQVLPELGHLQGARVGSPRRPGRTGRHRRRRGAGRLQERRLHLQRPGHLGRVRHRRGPRVPRARHQDRRRHRRLHHARGARRLLRPHGRGQRRPQGVHRGLLPPRHLRAPRIRSSRPCATSATRPTSGSRSPRCSSRATTTRSTRSIASATGSPAPSAPRCRSTSPPSTPTSR